MLNAKQIAVIVSTELDGMIVSKGAVDGIERAAEKIAAVLEEDSKLLVTAAALENEVTSTLMDMLAATVLATLIKEEGGGRANITFSPETMANMTRHFDYTVETEGLLRTVRITMKEGMKDSFFGEEPISAPSVMTDNEESTEGAKPQAAEHVYDRPYWAIAFWDRNGHSCLAKMLDRKDAEQHVKDYQTKDTPEPVIQNRFCMHPECPTTGCNEKTEVASA